MRLPSGERREWLKPIMFSAGIGQIDHTHITKGEPEFGMLIVKIGGPAYRIGMGGGAASSMVSGQNDAELDFNAVQRGDAEMAQKLYRAVRACIEMGDNPIVSIHDQGAGGNCNVVKEIIYPEGATIDIRSIVVGDHTMSVLEIWGAEYQEQDAILVNPKSRNLLESICKREWVSMAVIGTISGEGRVRLIDSYATEKPPAVDLELEKVLGDMPQKTFEFHRVKDKQVPLEIAPGITLMDSLERVLRLPSICSKCFLTTKVDRCVTGLVAQQQTVGPLQITLADVAVIAQTFTDYTGGACAIGEQPIKGLLDPKAMARLAVGEALTNLVWAKITNLSDVKASGNWMYAAKLDGEGAPMYDAAVALSEAMIELGFAIDGVKDSLSMAAQVSGEVVKAPGNLVTSAYVTCSDITKTMTPDLKLKDYGILVHIDLGKGKRRLGGSALSQVFDQLGDECPDVDDVSYLKTVFEVVQDLLIDELISAGHNISDGGLIVTVLEMAFAGNCEITGKVTAEPTIGLEINGMTHLNEKTVDLRDIWEETGFHIEKKHKLAACVTAEKEGLKNRNERTWRLTFTPKFTNENYMNALSKLKVAVIREEGSNGDWEMSAAFFASGFEPWDITILGVCNGCQLMALLGWIPGPKVGGTLGTGGDPAQPRFIHNESGVWAAHEGKAYFPDEMIFDDILSSNLAPLRYCDDDGKPTEEYPFNLNGSPLGVAAICSPDGRHLAMMHHPERMPENGVLDKVECGKEGKQKQHRSTLDASLARAKPSERRRMGWMHL
ncbi:hypothetical protein L1987_07558 [Smallanthus sonchifolius]|uniref:Uncharacterized protein n=1 Tax=Smallanthus sonchifolius TaxID=185202 RepID=A0ACB9K0X1_9ASTR|nr:hypothetical protein L1987_07558 [Smallanthus sonchifolius]